MTGSCAAREKVVREKEGWKAGESGRATGNVL